MILGAIQGISTHGIDLIGMAIRPGVGVGGGGGGTPKIFWQGCAAPVFDRIPLAKEILVKNIPLAKEDFLIMSPFLHDYKEFQPNYSLFKRNFPKTDFDLAPNCQFLGVFVKNIPLAKKFLPKIHPWLRNLGSKNDPWGATHPQ